MQIEKKIQLPDPDMIGDKTPLVLKFCKDLNESLTKYTQKLADLLNKGVKVIDNLDATIVTIDFINADTEYEISHAIKRIPNGFIILNIDKAAIIYDSGTAWTTTSIYLKSNTAATSAKLLIL